MVLRDHEDIDRIQRHAWICQVSFDGWADFCARNGVTFTALVDVLGHVLGSAHPPSWAASIVEEARQIDEFRRQRRRRG